MAISLQSFSSVDCLGQIYRGITKRQCLRHDDVISYYWDSKFQYFVKLVISYQPEKFQILQLFESNFTEVFKRHPKYHYDVIMTSFHNIWLSKLNIL